MRECRDIDLDEFLILDQEISEVVRRTRERHGWYADDASLDPSFNLHRRFLRARDSSQAPQQEASADAEQCDTAGLALPPGSCATVFGDKIGHVRHIVAGSDGLLYANSAPDREDTTLASGLAVLQDANDDGIAERIESPLPGPSGGTAVALFRKRIFLESGDRIVSHDFSDGIDRTEQVVEGLPSQGDHFSNIIAIRAAIWRFDTIKAGQRSAPAARFASGIRNAVGIALDSGGRLFAAQRGRDQLHENLGSLYSAERGQELPAEVLLHITQGADFGWPESYYDPRQRRMVLATEYGGDGGKAVGLCAGRDGALAAFPAHWAPNALAVHEGA